MKKHYYFNVSFAISGRIVAVIVKHRTPRMTAQRLMDARNLLELSEEEALVSVTCLGLMTEKQWNEEV